CSKLKAENVRPMSVNGYWVPEDWIEENVWLRFKNRFYWHWGVLRGKKETNELINNYFRDANCFEDLKKDKNFLLLNQSALKLNNIPNNSVDYCFTDPPYGGSIQYEELTLLWRSWLGFVDEETEKVLREKELIVNKYHPKDLNKYNEMLTDAIKEIYRVLKEGAWLSITFHNKDLKVWYSLLKAAQNAGFELMNIVPQEAIGKSFNQSATKGAPKKDLIVNFRKPNGNRFAKMHLEGSLTSEEIIVRSAKDLLKKRDSASLDELYDAAVSLWFDVTYSGVQKKHKKINFDANEIEKVLSARREFKRVVDTDLRGEAIKSKTSIWTKINSETHFGLKKEIHKLIEKCLKTNGAQDEGNIRTYIFVNLSGQGSLLELDSDLITEALKEFPKTDDGLYRLPNLTEEEWFELQANLKITKDIKKFLSGKLNRVPPDKEICEWIEHCYKNKLYSEADKLFANVLEQEVDPELYKRIKKIVKTCRMKMED
ncbi:MAG: DNA methyltransferase, partial [Methanosarcinales archaeon]